MAQKYRVDWDATAGRNGGAQQTVWEILMEMERFNGRAKAADQGALALVLDQAKALERVSLPVVWAWATHFRIPKEDFASAVGVLREHQFEGCAAEPLTTITAVLPGSKWSCLLVRIVLQDALNEVIKIYPPLKLRVFVDDITALLMVKNKVVAELAKKVTKKLKKGREERTQSVSDRRWEGRKEQDDCVVWIPGE